MDVRGGQGGQEKTRKIIGGQGTLREVKEGQRRSRKVKGGEGRLKYVKESQRRSKKAKESHLGGSKEIKGGQKR